LNPKAHQARDRALEAVENWRAWATDKSTSEPIDGDEDDPFWGSAFFRKRNELFSNMDGFDARAMASEDLSMLWLYVETILCNNRTCSLIVPIVRKAILPLRHTGLFWRHFATPSSLRALGQK
jgi:hypothetical protein